MLKDKKRNKHSEFNSESHNDLQNLSDNNSLTQESDGQSSTAWVNLATTGILSIFAGVASTGFIAGLSESIFEMTVPFDNPFVRLLAIFLAIGWWKIIRYWDTSE